MSPRKLFVALLAASALVATGVNPFAQSAGPQPAAMPAPTPAPRDVPYPGTIRLRVDATDIERHIFSVSETIPVPGGGQVTLLLSAVAAGQPFSHRTRRQARGPRDSRQRRPRLEWTRDPVDVFAFHVDVPAGASALDIEFQCASPVETNEGRVVMTPEMLNLQWNAVALYPAGYFTRQITVEASVRLPDGWQFGDRAGDRVDDTAA